MRKKIVYFIETGKEISGVQTIIPDILRKMPEECDAETYYINLSEEARAAMEAEKIAEEMPVSAEDDTIPSDENTADMTDEDDAGTSDEQDVISVEGETDASAEDETVSEEENDEENLADNETENENDTLFDHLDDNAEDQNEETSETDNKTVEELLEDEAEEETSNDESEEDTLKFVPLESCDFSEFEDATFIVPINYLFFLLPYIAELKGAKICPYVYDARCVTSFFRQMQRPKYREIAELLNSTGSCMFVNKDNATGWDYGLDQYGECVIPVSTDLCTAMDKKKAEFSPEVINIGWVGAISKTALDCINRICDDLYTMYGEDEEGNKRDVHMFDFHIMGIGAIMGQINFRKYSPLIRFIIPGDLKDNDFDEYVCSNIDIAFGYNMNAVLAALCGIPTLIPAIDDTPALAKRTYVYFGDATNYTLCWKKNELRNIPYQDYTMEEVIARLNDPQTREYDTARCYEYAVSHYSYEGNAKRIAEYTEQSALTVERILENESIAGVLQLLDDYRASAEENANATYYDYFNRNKKS
ncbi:MAG: hypothetical protein J1E39_05685 [Eubacterium sp.]|nr:hypothetical protein [Eubacterium sp.]